MAAVSVTGGAHPLPIEARVMRSLPAGAWEELCTLEPQLCMLSDSYPGLETAMTKQVKVFRDVAEKTGLLDGAMSDRVVHRLGMEIWGKSALVGGSVKERFEATLRSLKNVDLLKIYRRLPPSVKEVLAVPPFSADQSEEERADLIRQAFRENGERVKEVVFEDLTRGTTLILSGLGLTALPPEIFKMERVNEIFLSGNQLKALPNSFSPLELLTRLDLSGNQLTKLPASIASLPHLRTLKVSRNRLTKLPSLAGLPSLKSLDVSRNRLREMPSLDLRRCRDVDVRKNMLTTLPTEYLIDYGGDWWVSSFRVELLDIAYLPWGVPEAPPRQLHERRWMPLQDLKDQWTDVLKNPWGHWGKWLNAHPEVYKTRSQRIYFETFVKQMEKKGELYPAKCQALEESLGEPFTQAKAKYEASTHSALEVGKTINDPNRFLDYLIDAFASVRAEVGIMDEPAHAPSHPCCVIC